MEIKTIKHLNPVWREKANFIIGAKCTNATAEDSNSWEQLWSRKISDDTFEICCIPFFLYDISLGDEVKTDQDYWINDVIKRSGHFTFRVWFGNSTNPNIREEIIDRVNGLGCLFEWYSNNLLAIDAPTEDLAKQISGFLYEKEQIGLLIYETGRT
jgi:hypothetical protein